MLLMSTNMDARKWEDRVSWRDHQSMRCKRILRNLFPGDGWQQAERFLYEPELSGAGPTFSKRKPLLHVQIVFYFLDVIVHQVGVGMFPAGQRDQVVLVSDQVAIRAVITG